MATVKSCAVRVPDAVQRLFDDAPQSRDPRSEVGPRISSAPRRNGGALRSIRGTAQAFRAIKPPPTGMIAPVRNDAAGRHRLSVMLSDLKSDIECSRKMMSCSARLTRLAPIRREVKPRGNKRIEGAMDELDFSGKQVLVVGGSSGIGNGIAQAFRAHVARVTVCGTRASAAGYAPEEGSHLEGLDYAQLD